MNQHYSQGVNTKQAHKAIPEGYYEEEQGLKGFFGPVSHLIRKEPSTRWTKIEGPLKPRLFDLVELPKNESQQRLLYNNQINISWRWTDKKNPGELFAERSADGDLIMFCHQGSGDIFSEYGHLSYRRGHYIVIPKCVTYAVSPAEKSNFLVIENLGSHYEEPDRGIVGRHAIYDENALARPQLETQSKMMKDQGHEIKEVQVKHQNEITKFYYAVEVFDVLGWKGDLYPYTLHVDDMMPLMSHRAHLPPSAHSTFVARDFIVCTFLPRPLESDKDALKVPFYHQNIDYDEVLFYHDGDFFSRDNLHAGMMSFHPAGFPHGPHPKAVKNIDKKTHTDEYAVMIDTRWPLLRDSALENVEQKGLLAILAKIGAIITIDEAMQLALAEAKKGAGFTSPNPLVGAVVLDKNNKLLSVDYHKNYGGPHAEVNALNKLNDRQLEGAKIIVTLEPCAHEGKTPSCAKKLATLPISTVIYAVEDPNPLVAGKGLEILKESGKEVIHLSHYENEAIELAEIFFTNQKLKRPFVSLKVASSLDGYIGLQSGESQWITGEKARNYGHFLRATHDAICVGAKTFIVDNPKLNIRHNDFPNKKNKVIVLDSEGNLSDKIKSSNLIKYHSLEDILIIHPEKIKNKPEQDLKLIPVKYSQGFDVEDLLDKLFEKNIFSLLIEGGAKTYQLFLESKKFDRLFCFIAPSLIGQKNGLSWTKDLVTRSLSEKLSFDKLKAIPLDPDILLTMKTSDNH